MHRQLVSKLLSVYGTTRLVAKEYDGEEGWESEDSDIDPPDIDHILRDAGMGEEHAQTSDDESGSEFEDVDVGDDTSAPAAARLEQSEVEAANEDECEKEDDTEYDEFGKEFAEIRKSQGKDNKYALKLYHCRPTHANKHRYPSERELQVIVKTDGDGACDHTQHANGNWRMRWSPDTVAHSIGSTECTGSIDHCHLLEIQKVVYNRFRQALMYIYKYTSSCAYGAQLCICATPEVQHDAIILLNDLRKRVSTTDLNQYRESDAERWKGYWDIIKGKGKGKGKAAPDSTAPGQRAKTAKRKAAASSPRRAPKAPMRQISQLASISQVASTSASASRPQRASSSAKSYREVEVDYFDDDQSTDDEETPDRQVEAEVKKLRTLEAEYEAQKAVVDKLKGRT